MKKVRKELDVSISGYPMVIRDASFIKELVRANPDLKQDIRYRTVSASKPRKKR